MTVIQIPVTLLLMRGRLVRFRRTETNSLPHPHSLFIHAALLSRDSRPKSRDSSTKVIRGLPRAMSGYGIPVVSLQKNLFRNPAVRRLNGFFVHPDANRVGLNPEIR